MVTKKDYFKNAQVGRINKVALNNFFGQSTSYEIELTKIDRTTGEYEGKFNGKVKIMSYSKDFQDQVLQFMYKIDSKVDNIEKDVKDIKSRLNILEKDVKDIKSRLNILEKDVKEIKSLPTIKKELKEKK